MSDLRDLLLLILPLAITITEHFLQALNVRLEQLQRSEPETAPRPADLTPGSGPFTAPQTEDYETSTTTETAVHTPNSTRPATPTYPYRSTPNSVLREQYQRGEHCAHYCHRAARTSRSILPTCPICDRPPNF